MKYQFWLLLLVMENNHNKHCTMGGYFVFVQICLFVRAILCTYFFVLSGPSGQFVKCKISDTVAQIHNKPLNLAIFLYFPFIRFFPFSILCQYYFYTKSFWDDLLLFFCCAYMNFEFTRLSHIKSRIIRDI